MHPCPRQRYEATMPAQFAHVSYWRDDETCSYCGSLSPAAFFAAIEAGVELGPTDKDYKVYVRRANRFAGQPCIAGSANFDPDYGGTWVRVTAESIATLPKIDYYGRPSVPPPIGHWAEIGTAKDRTVDKFYFQHLSPEERVRFVELLNAKRLTIGEPGYFYRLPFFVRKETP